MRALCLIISLLLISEYGFAAAIDCDAMWKKRVSLNKKGVVREYTIKTDLKVPGLPAVMAQTMNQSMKQTHEIQESSLKLIKTKVTTTGSTMAIPMQVISEKKKDFILNCKKFITKGVPVLPKGAKADVKIVSKSKGSKKVKAGTFNCDYTKVKTKIDYNGQTGDGFIESWLSGAEYVGFIVLMTQDMKISMAGMKGKLKSRMELVKGKR